MRQVYLVSGKDDDNVDSSRPGRNEENWWTKGLLRIRASQLTYVMAKKSLIFQYTDVTKRRFETYSMLWDIQVSKGLETSKWNVHWSVGNMGSWCTNESYKHKAPRFPLSEGKMWRRGCFVVWYNPCSGIQSQPLGKRCINRLNVLLFLPFQQFLFWVSSSLHGFKPNRSQRLRNFFRTCLNRGSD